MKRTMRKLALNRETLRNLEDAKMREALGGLSQQGTCFATICQPTVANCVSVGIICTTT
jgi:hypothetical protein